MEYGGAAERAVGEVEYQVVDEAVARKSGRDTAAVGFIRQNTRGTQARVDAVVVRCNCRARCT
jgi:hypothetical protein